MSEAEHLHEVGHRAFATIVLPVGIGDEADRRIERQILRYRRHLGRIERQHRLQAHQRVEDQKAADMEEQHRDGVRGPVLLAPLVDAADTIKRHFDRPQDR